MFKMAAITEFDDDCKLARLLLHVDGHGGDSEGLAVVWGGEYLGHR